MITGTSGVSSLTGGNCTREEHDEYVAHEAALRAQGWRPWYERENALNTDTCENCGIRFVITTDAHVGLCCVCASAALAHAASKPPDEQPGSPTTTHEGADAMIDTESDATITALRDAVYTLSHIVRELCDHAYWATESVEDRANLREYKQQAGAIFIPVKEHQS